MPVFPYKLAPGQVVKYGANIPMKKGVPKTGLSHFVNCGAPGTRRLEEQQHDHEVRGQQRGAEREREGGTREGRWMEFFLGGGGRDLGKRAWEGAGEGRFWP